MKEFEDMLNTIEQVLLMVLNHHYQFAVVSDLQNEKDDFYMKINRINISIQKLLSAVVVVVDDCN
jgi:hypothetical protein